MNKSRRTRLEKINDRLIDVKQQLSRVCGEEEDAISNMPENLQSSDRYMEMEDAYELMAAAIDHIETAQYKLKEVYSDEL